LPSKPYAKNVLLIGGSGFVGRLLGAHLHAAGYSVRVLSRAAQLSLPYPAQVYRWQADTTLPATALTDVDVVVNLAGASVAKGRWTQRRKAELIASRVQTTQAMVMALRQLSHQPVVIQAAACGYYGARGAAELVEDSDGGAGFLASTAQQWEDSLSGAGLENRYVILRLGLVLGEGGGALRVLRKIYRGGGGAVLGSGKQYVSWVHSDDVCGYVCHVLRNRSCRGVYNLTAPTAITYEALHRALLRRFRPVLASPVRIPAQVLHLLLGEKATLVTASQRVVPQRTLATGYHFKFTEIDAALQSIRRF